MLAYKLDVLGKGPHFFYFGRRSMARKGFCILIRPAAGLFRITLTVILITYPDLCPFLP